jgi:multiple sugar transport system ATP-binding protein
MRLEFKKLQKEFKATILYVSHDQLEAMTMGDRVVVMNEGSIQQVGKPRDIFERPANRFVAGFVGEPSMNIVDGAIKLREGRPSVGFANQILRLPADAKLQADGAIAIGVRPQHIQVTNESGDNVIFGKVYAAETLGSETIVDVQVDGKLLRALVKNKDVGDLNTEMGARIGLYINPHAIYLFDSTSGLTTTQADLRKITHG